MGSAISKFRKYRSRRQDQSKWWFKLMQPESAVADSFGTDGADLVIECSGAAPAVKTLSDVARRGARFYQMGLYGKPVWFDQDAVCYKELVVTGTNATVTSSWIRALKLLVEGRIDAHRLISHRFSIRDWDQALDVMKNRKA